MLAPDIVGQYGRLATSDVFVTQGAFLKKGLWESLACSSILTRGYAFVTNVLKGEGCGSNARPAFWGNPFIGIRALCVSSLLWLLLASLLLAHKKQKKLCMSIKRFRPSRPTPANTSKTSRQDQGSVSGPADLGFLRQNPLQSPAVLGSASGPIARFTAMALSSKKGIRPC